jgi:hypothetical protein
MKEHFSRCSSLSLCACVASWRNISAVATASHCALVLPYEGRFQPLQQPLNVRLCCQMKEHFSRCNSLSLCACVARWRNISVVVAASHCALVLPAEGTFQSLQQPLIVRRCCQLKEHFSLSSSLSLCADVARWRNISAFAAASHCALVLPAEGIFPPL